MVPDYVRFFIGNTTVFTIWDCLQGSTGDGEPLALLYLLPGGLAHTNIPLSLGRFALVLNNPQYH
jgi:hypothetical protein